MIIDSDYNHEIWDEKSTFVGPCKCEYCKTEFKGRFVEAAHERIICPECGKSLTFGER